MTPAKKQFGSIDEYIETFPRGVREILENIRQTVRDAAPQAVETISYQIPAFKLNGKYLVYFAAFKNHIGVYPIPSGNKALDKALAPYKKGKGTAQFPLSEPLPYHLVKRIVLFRAKEASAQKAAARR
jgi:uncharacterized protein YdhG (YjbR/CyaY superfamily)